MFLKPTEFKDVINRPRATGRPRKETLQVEHRTVLDGAAPTEEGLLGGTPADEAIEMMDITDEAPSS